MHDASGGSRLSFELEVCRVARLNLIGIRRKRLKGDAWKYKKVCEEVLRLAQTTSGSAVLPDFTVRQKPVLDHKASYDFTSNVASSRGVSTTTPRVATQATGTTTRCVTNQATTTNVGVQAMPSTPLRQVDDRTRSMDVEEDDVGAPKSKTSEMSTQTDPSTPI